MANPQSVGIQEIISLDEMKNYLRVTYDDDDEYIKSLLCVADSYMEGAITNFREKIKEEKFRVRAEMAAKALVSHLYDERFYQGKKLELNYVIHSLMLQIEVEECIIPDEIVPE